MRVKGGSFQEMAQEIKAGKKRILIFGAGVIGTVTVPELLASYHLDSYVKGYLDNDENRWGELVMTRFGSKPVYSPMWLREIDKNIVILLSISRYSEVLSQLEQMEGLESVACYIVPVMCIMNFHRDGGQGVRRESEEPFIPKIIHYMWLGDKTIPDNLQYCLNSWKRYCPDYEIVRWDENNYDVGKHPYMKQAYKNRMYGFIPDYARLDILYHYGGIYMDTDVEIIKPLDELLYQQAFCGVEKWQVINFGGLSGAVKGHRALEALLEERQGVVFEETDGRLNKNTCGYYDTRVALNHGYRIDGTNQRILDMNIYTYDYFHPYDYISRRMEITGDTFSIHHFNGGWLDEKLKLANAKTAQEFEALVQRIRSGVIERRELYGAGVSAY